jgi:hypothetical protein
MESDLIALFERETAAALHALQNYIPVQRLMSPKLVTVRCVFHSIFVNPKTFIPQIRCQ